VENNSICRCSHELKNHDDLKEHCWVCFALNLDDNQANVPVNDRHSFCEKFKQDNLKWLEMKANEIQK
jgi:hypothetical protein